jgi:hypothetical protein
MVIRLALFHPERPMEHGWGSVGHVSNKLLGCNRKKITCWAGAGDRVTKEKSSTLSSSTFVKVRFSSANFKTGQNTFNF